MKFSILLLFSWCIVTALSPSNTLRAIEQKSRTAEKAWNPPKTTIPGPYVLAANGLLGHGLSDPRGGKLRRVKVFIGNASWSPKFGEYDTIGWVMAGGKKVVLRDGLTYEIASNLGPASMTDLVEGVEQSVPRIIYVNDSILINGETIALPALLLICGESKLAEEVYSRIGMSTIDPLSQLNKFLFDRYKMQVAHCLMAKRDKESVYWATNLVEVAKRKPVEKLPIELRSNDPEYSLETATQILNDTIRRAKHSQKTLDLSTLSKMSSAARIDALILELDELSARQWGQPGGVDVVNTLTVQAIIKEGKAAVPALLNAMETDNRLTRSVSFGRDFFPMRNILSVKRVAQACLQQIWPASALEKPEPRESLVPRLRKIWNQSSGMTEPERYLTILMDDSAGIQTWSTAAKALTRRIRIEQVPSRAGNQVKKELFGESLRSKNGEELASILIKRIQQTVAIPKIYDTMELHRFEEGMQIAHCLAKWDITKSAPSIKLTCENTLRIASDWKQNSHYPETMLFNTYSLLVCDLLQGNDPEAANYYSRLENSCHLSLELDTSILRPLWNAPNNAEIQGIGMAFLDRFLANLNTKDEFDADIGMRFICDGLRVPLIKSPAYRSTLVEALKCKYVVGSARIRESGKDFILEHRLLGGGQGNRGPISKSDATDMSRGFILITAADYICQQITFLKEAVPFSMVWPQAKRTEGIKKTVEWLQDSSVDWEAVAKAQEYYDYVDNL